MSSRPQGYELLSLCISHLLNVPPVIRQTLQQGTYLIRSASSYDPKLYLCLMSDEFIGVKRLEHGDDTVKWKVVPRKDGFYQLLNSSNDAPVGVTADKLNASSPVDCNRFLVWAIEPFGDAYIICISTTNGCAVSLKRDNSVTLQQYNGAKDQCWIFQAIDVHTSDLYPGLLSISTKLISPGDWRKAHKQILAGSYTLRNRHTKCEMVVWDASGKANTPLNVMPLDSLTVCPPVARRFEIQHVPDGGLRVVSMFGFGGSRNVAVTGHVRPRALPDVGTVVVTNVRNSCRFIPTMDAPGYYFISTDLASEPARVIADRNHDYVKDGMLHVEDKVEGDRRQQWRLVPTMPALVD